ncbi:hypothetical protein ACH5RR_027574 [Cinchona calisaya]|uniref:Ribosome biogenesis protein BMS1/TSR1 C-terminal domain-containing protein n=1 Tax=Cinchona calisaya TaxID=153742 RepID=A0ABD2Z5U5_9GENT
MFAFQSFQLENLINQKTNPYVINWSILICRKVKTSPKSKLRMRFEKLKQHMLKMTESLPAEYARIFAFDNFSETQKHVFAKAQEMEQGNENECIPAGSYARLHIKELPSVVVSRLSNLGKTTPVISCGLLQHESKISILHFSIRKHDTYTAPLKAKEELTFHVGFRQFVARPLYSSDNINSEKHKMERFLHAGRFSIVSVYGLFAPRLATLPVSERI